MRSLTALAVAWCACGRPPSAPAPRGEGESCATPFRLLADRLEASTFGFNDDEGSERSACGGSGAPDLVVTFTAARGSQVDVTVTPTDSSYQPIVKLRGADKGCVELDDACDAAIGRGKVAEVLGWAPALQGTQYLIIDGASMSAGRFSLKVVTR